MDNKDALSPDYRLILYNPAPDLSVYNVALVQFGVRPGALINACLQSMAWRLAHFAARFPELYAKQHSTQGNIILCRADNAAACAKIDELGALGADIAVSNDRFDVLTGEILGYATPVSLKVTNGIPDKVAIAKLAAAGNTVVTLYAVCEEKQVHMFSQNVFGKLDRAPLEAMAALANSKKDEINAALSLVNPIGKFVVDYKTVGGRRRTRKRK